MTRLPLAAALAALALLLAAAGAQAAVPAQWTATADGLAAQYAAAHGWHDYCAGQNVPDRVEPLADGVAGLAYITGPDQPSCSLGVSIDDDYAKTPIDYCQVRAHERLHQARQDGWHDLADGSSPLAPVVGGFRDCIAAYSLSGRDARAALRAWRPRARLRVSEEGGRLDYTTSVVVQARARARRSRWRSYLVERADAGQPGPAGLRVSRYTPLRFARSTRALKLACAL